MADIVLQKVLSGAGIASRRGAEKLILAGKVSVNGRRISTLGDRVDPETDVVKINNKIVTRPAKVYFALNKPAGYISSVADEKDRKTVVGLIKTKERIFPVGRLDINTTGLLLLTNDGDLAFKLTHPSFEVEKEYQALIRAPQNWSQGFLQKNLDKFKSGVSIAGGFKTSPAAASVIKKSGGVNSYLITIVVHEGKKHEVRQMLSAIGASTLKLRRVRLGKLRLGSLREGEYRQLTQKEVAACLA